MKHEERFSFLVHAKDEQQYLNIQARLRAGTEGRMEFISVADKNGHDILVINAPNPAIHYANGATCQPVAKESVPDIKAGIRLRSLEQEVADFKAERNGTAIYSGPDVLASLKDASNTLYVQSPRELITVEDLKVHGQRLALAAIQALEGGKNQKELEARIKEADEEREKVIGERDIALRDFHTVSEKGQAYLRQKTELEAEVKTHETGDVLRKLKADYERVNAELAKTLQGVHGKDEYIQRLEHEKNSFLEAMRTVKAEAGRAKTEKAQMEEKLERARDKLTQSERKLYDAKKELGRYTTKPEPPALVEATSARTDSAIIAVPTSGILIPDPNAETSKLLFGYIAFGRALDTDMTVISSTFERHNIQSHRNVGGRGATHLYFFGQIDRAIEYIVSDIMQFANSSQTAEKMKTDIRDYFTAGDQCGYNPKLWQTKEGTIDRTTIALVARISLETLKNKLQRLGLPTLEEHYPITKVANILFSNPGGHGVARPKEVYKT